VAEAKGKTDGTITLVSKERAPLGRGDACLIVIHGDDLGRRHALQSPVTAIGRSQTNHVTVDQESVSRHHATIQREGGALVLRDLGSTNGTYVNDLQVKEGPLHDGDLVQIGRTIFKVLLGESVEAAYHEEVFRLSTTDGLTQIWNRRYFMDQLGREFARARRYGRPLSVILLDLDRFKRINDRHGHLCGDHVLKQVAATLRSNLRQEDVPGRYGGEEFAVALPEIDGTGARKLAEKIRRLIGATRFAFEDERIRLTVSIGVATMEADTEGVDALLNTADERLYEAKRTGRNRVGA
jgi:diguanylate cyclase (GGDEF)-like protein